MSTVEIEAKFEKAREYWAKAESCLVEACKNLDLARIETMGIPLPVTGETEGRKKRIERSAQGCINQINDLIRNRGSWS